jgi:hypothetical protein
VAALEVAKALPVRSFDVGNRDRIVQVVAREFGWRYLQKRCGLTGDEGAGSIALCTRVAAGHAMLDDGRILAAFVDGQVAEPDIGCLAYVLALGSVLDDF